MSGLFVEVLQSVRVGVLFVLAASFTGGLRGGKPCLTVFVNGPKSRTFTLTFSFIFLYAARTFGPLILDNKLVNKWIFMLNPDFLI